MPVDAALPGPIDRQQPVGRVERPTAEAARGERPGTARRSMAGERPRISIAIALALAIGALVLVSAGLVLIIAIFVSGTTVRGLIEDRARLTVELINEAVNDHTRRAVEQVSFLGAMVRVRQIDPTNRTDMTLATAAALAATPQMLALTYWSPELGYVRMARHPGGGADVIGGGLEDGANPLGLASNGATDQPFWGEVVWVPEAGVSAINIRQPVWRNGRLEAGFVGLMSLAELSRILASAQTGARDFSPFIMANDGYVFAHPNLRDGSIRVTAEQPLPHVRDVRDPVLAALWAHQMVPEAGVNPLHTDDPKVPPGSMYSVQVQHEGQPFLLLARENFRVGDYAIKIGASQPLAEAERELRQLGYAAGGGVAVLIAALFAALLIGRRIARPVERLAAAATQVGRLELSDVPVLPGSMFRELDTQSRAFNTMLSGLRWFETYVPRALVRRLVAGGEAISSEEREVTVMFTDIAGFTARAESLSAVSVADLINDHFTMVCACIEAEGGTVDKFIGDAVMAFWNAPDRQPDHAARAIRAALAIRAGLRADNEALSADVPPIGMRIGIHTGPVVVGNIGPPGRVNYTIVGDAVNTAQRLEQLGKSVVEELPDPSIGNRDAMILASAETVARLSSDHGMLAAGTFMVKGKAQPMMVYRPND